MKVLVICLEAACLFLGVTSFKSWLKTVSHMTTLLLLWVFVLAAEKNLHLQPGAHILAVTANIQ